MRSRIERIMRLACLIVLAAGIGSRFSCAATWATGPQQRSPKPRGTVLSAESTRKRALPHGEGTKHCRLGGATDGATIGGPVRGAEAPPKTAVPALQAGTVPGIFGISGPTASSQAQPPPSMAHALVALGSNLGDRASLLQGAVDALAAAPGVRLLSHSAWIETAPVGGPAGQQPFLNGAALLETRLEPEALHALLLEIERRAGRQRSQRWGPRTLDLDLLLYDECVLQTAELQIPHPRLALRRFVLLPACQIAPQMRHPQIGWTISQLLQHLESAPPYFAIAATSQAVAEWLAEFASQAAGCRLIADPLAGLPPPQHPSAAAGSLAHAPPLELARARAVAIDRRAWSEPQRPAISSFWIEQHLAEALLQAAIPPEQMHAQWLHVAEHAMPPKLLIVYVTPEAATEPALRPHAWPKLADLARRTGRGPLLWIEAAPPDEAAEEILAAIEGMQTTHTPGA